MEKVKTDILVIGGGASGMAAAAAASEQNVKVMVAESKGSVGGNGLFPRGIFAVGSPIQKQKLIFADKDEVFRDCMNYSHWKIDGRIIRALIEKSGDTIKWLMDMGVEFYDVVHHIPNQNPEVFHITSPKENAGRVVMRTLERVCRERGVDIRTATPAKSLITDGKKVTGAVLSPKDGEDIEVTAGKVIICSGGFAGNEEMIKEYLPEYDPERIAHNVGMLSKGDGLRMAKEAGADIEGNFTMEMASPKITGHAPLNLLLGKPYNVWLNSFGKRFCDEGIVYNFALAANAALRQPGAVVYVFFNEAMIQRTLRDGRDMIELIHIPEDAESKLQSEIEAAQKDGTLCKASDLSGIADFMGVKLEDLEDEIWEYNTFCMGGRDKLFAKDIRYLHEMKDGPFYCVKAGVDMLITHGGIRVDEYFNALDKDQLPVENLFAAGVDFGGADADIYNVNMSGHGFGFALNSGRIAGETAAMEIKNQG